MKRPYPSKAAIEDYERARAREKALAQLGARVLEILRDWSISADGVRRENPKHPQFTTSAAEMRIIVEARSLGLLGEQGVER